MKNDLNSINQDLEKLLSNQIVQDIFSKINNNFSRYSFQEMSSFMKAFHQVIRKTLHTDLKLYINNETEDNIGRSVFLSNEDESLIINGLNRNPYFYLRDILLMHLLYLNKNTYDFVQVGNASYDKNYMQAIGDLDTYNKHNIKYVEAVKKFMDKAMIQSNNQYVREYENDLDNVITPLGIDDMIKANKAIDEYCSSDLYTRLKNIAIKISKMQEKKNLDIEETALLSLNDVVTCYIFAVERNKNLKSKLTKHYKKFIKTYFSEYESDIAIELDELGIYINNRLIKDNEMFMDVMFQEIAKIEQKSPRIDSIISDKQFYEFDDANLGYSKLDIYFYHICQNIDIRLSNGGYELINYMPYTKIYKSKNHPSIFTDNRNVFSDLIEDNNFISLIERSFNCKEKNLNEIYQKIIKILNDAYGANFKLEIKNINTCDTSIGVADHNENILYINVNKSANRLEILTTFLHEYRHLIQYQEIKTNTGIYNKYAYELIKLNGKESPFEKDYWYCSMAHSGYDNFLYYTMQPLELDAEDFSYKMSKQIIGKLKTSMKLSDEYFNDTYRDNIYFNREMMSIETYRNFLKSDSVHKIYQEEKKDQIKIIEMLDNAKTEEDARNLFKFRQFAFLPIEKKLNVYQLVLESYESIRYNKQEKTIHIGKQKIDLKKDTDYQILEKLLKIKALKLVQQGKLTMEKFSSYIYKESLKYKADNYDMFNALTAYDYHTCFDKYFRSDKQTKRKRR